MQLLFFVIVGTGLFYLLTAHRRCDTFTLAFVSACIYFMPGFFGSVPGGFNDESPVPIETETYAVMSTVLAAILYGAWLWDCGGSRSLPDRNCGADLLAIIIALLISLTGLFIAVWTDLAGLLSPYKEDVLQATSRSFMLLGFGASLAVILAFAQRRWIAFAPAFVLLLFTVFVGLRSYFAMSVIAMFLIHFQRQGAQRMHVRNLHAIVFAGALGMSLITYKCVCALVKFGAYDEVFERLSEPEFFLDAVISSEPFTTQLVLNEVLRTGFETDFDYIIYSVVGQFTLFSGEAGIVFQSFNNLFQPALFPELEFGMANNIWAQMLAAGGWPLFLGFLAAFVWTLRVTSRWMASERVTMRAGVALASAYLCFYIHRNDLGYELSELKRVLLVWTIVTAIASLGWSRKRAEESEELVETIPIARPQLRPRPRARAA